jgi:YD repeat-containing protein
MIRHLELAELQQLLEERLGATERLEAEAHLKECPSCRQTLEQITETLVPATARGTDSTLATPLSFPPLPDTEVGRPTVPGFDILEELGRGGMGVVYKARHIGLDRLVALKMILHSDYAGRQMRERFHIEARALARVQHPNIVPIYEVGEHQGRPYFALEYCGGGSLAQRLAGKPQPPREAAALVEVMARAMHVAHQANVIHRDLKPGNVLLAVGQAFQPDSSASNVRLESLTFTAKITDFGLAKRLDEAAQTVSGEVLGTPSYMAPEQASGRNKEIGPATDVYALGAILYECLTGQPPFKGPTTAETLLQVLVDEPLAPRKLQPGIPRDLETICLKCLHKQPTQRYLSTAALADDLRAFLDGRSIQARPAPRWERAWKWCKRRPAAATALFAVVVLLFAALAGGLWYWDGYLRTHVEYYRTFVRRDGLEQGVGRVRATEVKHRWRTRKYYRRAGRLVKVEIVNGHDEPMQDQAGTIIEGVDPQYDQERPCSYEFHYNQGGDVAEVIARHRSGQVTWSLHYTTRTTAHFTDHRGYVRPGKGSEAAYVKFVRGAGGLEKEHHFLNSAGRPQPTRNGVYGRRFEHDPRGLMIEATYLDVQGKPVRGKDGFATMTWRYDEEGNAREIAYFGPDGQPALYKDGYARVDCDYDSHGNLIEVSCFGVDGKATLHKEGFAIYRSRYGAWGNLIETAYFGVDGKPALHKLGFHKITCRHDERGNVVERAYFDTDSEPTLHASGMAIWRHRFDEWGNIIEGTYFGTDGKPVLNKEGFHRAVSRNDDRGNLLERAYYDTDGKPTLHGVGNAIWKLRYDERGNQVERANFGTDGKPTLNKQGYHRIECQFDERGNLVKQSVFATDGKPTLNRQGFHRIESRFDERGNLFESAYFGTDDKPTLHKDGNARVQWKYDDRGNRIEQSYFGMDGQPTAQRDGTFCVQWKYDEHGNKVEEVYLDAAGKPMRVNGVARIVTKYDERSHRIEAAYFDSHGKPATNTDGAARMTWKYDARGNRIEVAYFGSDGKAGDKYGYACTTWTCDERGNQIEEAYFGADGKPKLYNGVAKLLMKYDSRGNQIEQAYFGQRGEPVKQSAGHHKMITKYDERGNRIEQTYFAIDGKPTGDRDGCARMTWAHDERGNRIEEAYFGPDRKPLLSHRYVKLRLKYDGRGNQIELAYLDGENKPARPRDSDGFKRWTARYDARDRLVQKTFHGYDAPEGCAAKSVDYNLQGNALTEVYQDAGGKMVRNLRLGYARIVNQYDPSGRQWLAVTHFDETGQRVRTEAVIQSVIPGGQAARAGLRANDVFVTYDGKPVVSVNGFVAATNRRLARGKIGLVSLRVRRDGKERQFVVLPGRVGVFLEDRAAVK